MKNNHEKENQTTCGNDPELLLHGRSLIIVSNRGPIDISEDENGNLLMQRNAGGLVTALLGLAQNIDITWVASAINDLEKNWGHGQVALDENGCAINLHLVPLEQDVYDGYYNTISNPLLWFLQHSMWDFITSPTITRSTWEAWEKGYVVANKQFAETVAQRVRVV